MARRRGGRSGRDLLLLAHRGAVTIIISVFKLVGVESLYDLGFSLRDDTEVPQRLNAVHVELAQADADSIHLFFGVLWLLKRVLSPIFVPSRPMSSLTCGVV